MITIVYRKNTLQKQRFKNETEKKYIMSIDSRKQQVQEASYLRIKARNEMWDSQKEVTQFFSQMMLGRTQRDNEIWNSVQSFIAELLLNQVSAKWNCWYRIYKPTWNNCLSGIKKHRVSPIYNAVCNWQSSSIFTLADSLKEDGYATLHKKTGLSLML